MKYKVLDINDIDLMQSFVDDENTKYEKENLISFINDKNAYGFIARDENKIVGFAYGYTLIRPDGKKDFYLHAIDIMVECQGKGYGTGLMNYIKGYVKEISCRKMFLITNKSNISACKCYEKAGGVNNADDEIVYVYK
ncbi:MAG: GNAT family N-acetyltransferase [Clostridiales bacterium]|nr:GNAT family N-acetyltransferase [Clostridiales bacterium]